MFYFRQFDARACCLSGGQDVSRQLVCPSWSVHSPSSYFPTFWILLPPFQAALASSRAHVQVWGSPPEHSSLRVSLHLLDSVRVLNSPLTPPGARWMGCSLSGSGCYRRRYWDWAGSASQRNIRTCLVREAEQLPESPTQISMYRPLKRAEGLP